MAYIDVNKLTHIRFMCHKVLPAVYDESLSYLEGLAKLTYKLNETIDGLNALDDNVDLLNDVVVDLNTRVEAVEGSVSTFLEEMTRIFNELAKEQEQKIDAKLADVDAQMQEIDSRVTTLENELDSKIAEFDKEIDDAIKQFTQIINAQIRLINQMYAHFEAEMKAYVEEEVQKAIHDIPDLTTVYVIDPTTGKLSKIQDALNNVFDFHAYNALTVKEWNDLGLKVKEANKLIVKSIPRGFTVREWLHDAKKLLVTQLEASKAKLFAPAHSFVRDYFKGNLVWHDKNVDTLWLGDMISGCYSVGEWNTLGVTVADWNDKGVKVSEFLLRGNTIFE